MVLLLDMTGLARVIERRAVDFKYSHHILVSLRFDSLTTTSTLSGRAHLSEFARLHEHENFHAGSTRTFELMLPLVDTKHRTTEW